MEQYAANVSDDFERDATNHAGEESPGPVADTQEDLHQQTDGKDSSKENIAPQRRQVADLLEAIANAVRIESIVERALSLISLTIFPREPTPPTKIVTSSPPGALTRTLNVVSISSNIRLLSQWRTSNKENQTQEKSIDSKSLPFPRNQPLVSKLNQVK